MPYDRKQWPFWRRTSHWGLSLALAACWSGLAVLSLVNGESPWRTALSGVLAAAFVVSAAIDLARVRRYDADLEV